MTAPADKFLEFLCAQIAAFDRLVDESAEKGFLVDVEIYNFVSHTLRHVRDEYKRLAQ